MNEHNRLVAGHGLGDPTSTMTDRELLEARITAHALGDLAAVEAAEIERLLADPSRADERRQVEEVRRVAAALKGGASEAGGTRSPDLRRAVVAAATAPRPKWSADIPEITFPPVAPTHRFPPVARRPQRPWWGALTTLGTLAVAMLFMATLFIYRQTERMVAVRQPVPQAAGKEDRDALMAAADRKRSSEPSRDEGYATVAESRTLSPREQPLSTFSIDVDTASYANVRRFLVGGRLPPRDAVRIEELVNYFRYDYPQPEGDVPFSVTVDAAECPWKPGHRLVRIGLQGRDIDRGARPAGNLVFLVDVSGSMQAANKLALVKQALAMLVEELTENDRVSIVTYAGNAGLALPPTTGDQKQTIRTAIEALEAGGSTHGSAGIALAYEQAREHFIPGGSNRVILATDGDLNVGVTSTTALIDLIKEKARAGVFLTVLGFGEGNLQDEKMEALADNGNGVYAYIDGVREARKVLVEQLTGSTVTIAKDVKIQVEFNPAQVASYRLLGYENRALAARDFRDDTKDAGEIGAGHSVTAVYEIAIVGEEAFGPGVEPLKYQPRSEPQAASATPAAVDPAASRELLTVKLRWKRPDADESTGLEVALADRGPAFDGAPTDLRFAAAVAAFGMILRESSERGDATLPLVAWIAGAALGRDEGGYRAEFLDLVRRAEGLGVAR